MLNRKAMLITGAASGIGAAAAILFAHDGTKPMRTERSFVDNPKFTAMAPKVHPLSRLGQARKVAEAPAWLLSDRASFVPGHTLAVDGGFSAV